MIKILHLVSSLSVSSGVMSVIMNYYRHINTDKVQFDFLYFKESDNSYSDEIKKMGGEVYFFSKPAINKKYKNDLEQILTNTNNSYTAFHIHVVHLTHLLAPIVKSFGTNNVITHSHNTMYSDKPIASLRNRIMCLPLKKQANHYFACSIAAGEFLYGKKSMQNGKVKVINNAISCINYKFTEESRNIIRRELNLEDNIVIGHVGRFKEQKNHTFLIDIFSSIKKKENKSKLMLVGDGPLLKDIKKQVSAKGLDEDVLFLGRRSNIPDLLNAMDIFVLPSLFEGLPVVGVEAQASGLPIVLSSEITKEIGLFNYKYIGLDKPVDYWANEILNMKTSQDRTNAYYETMEWGFDIAKEAMKLEEMYLSMK